MATTSSSSGCNSSVAAHAPVITVAATVVSSSDIASHPNDPEFPDPVQAAVKVTPGRDSLAMPVAVTSTALHACVCIAACSSARGKHVWFAAALPEVFCFDPLEDDRLDFEHWKLLEWSRRSCCRSQTDYLENNVWKCDPSRDPCHLRIHCCKDSPCSPADDIMVAGCIARRNAKELADQLGYFEDSPFDDQWPT